MYNSNLFNKYNTDFEIENYLTWIGLLIGSLFSGFSGPPKHSSKQKWSRNYKLILIFSTIPVIISGIFNIILICGPFKFLNGLIIWYQRPIDEISGLTGLFNHANYAGAWLTIILPLCLSQSFNNSKILKEKCI